MLLFIIATLLATVTAEPSCDSGWVKYKDELCIKLFNTLETYDGARELCSSQGTEISQSSLVMIKDSEIHEALSNYTFGMLDHIWLGGKFDNESAQFKWDHGEPLTYTNWQKGYPRNETESRSCIELRPTGAKMNSDQGKWANEPCQKRNMVMCQKPLSWSLQDAVTEILRIRKENAETRKQLELVSARVVPIGSIYIEYRNQPSPSALWPDLTWSDVTSKYAGVFFRALGGGSTTWGRTQTACFPRITHVEYNFSTDEEPFPGWEPVSIPENGDSEYFRVGAADVGNDTHAGLKMTTTNCEVRPVNQAIRLWKRMS